VDSFLWEEGVESPPGRKARREGRRGGGALGGDRRTPNEDGEKKDQNTDILTNRVKGRSRGRPGSTKGPAGRGGKVERG